MVFLPGLILVGYAGVLVLWPYRVARFGERVNAIGSQRRWDEVEPATWNVELTRVMGIAFVFVGLVFTFAE